MNPHQASWLVVHRMGELQQGAAEHRLARSGAGHRSVTRLRRQAGWWLVDVGLKLAVGRGQQAGVRAAPSAS
jgi:hypothetical protein